MRVTCKGNRYELTLLSGMVFKLRQLWFPMRRIARAVRRTILELRGWLVTLLIFIPIGAVVLSAMVALGCLGPESAITEFVLMLLGSVLLLTIKETRDDAARRRAVLVEQWKHYASCRGSLNANLYKLFHALGLSVDHRDMLASRENLERALSDATCSDVPMDDNALDEATCSIFDIVERYIDLSIKNEWIDWDGDEASTIFESCLPRSLAAVRSSSKEGFEERKRSLSGLSDDLLRFVAILRRPWRYPVDVAHNQLLEKYLERQGVRLG